MYTDRVSHLYLNKSKLHILKGGNMSEYGERVDALCTIPGEADIEAFFGSGKPSFSPDFTTKGRFMKTALFKNPVFNITDVEPTHQLFITGISTATKDIGLFRTKEPVCFSSYWEDNIYETGYLFQVVELIKTNKNEYRTT